MESFSQTTGFRYNLNSNTTGGDDDAEFSGILEIYAHHARNLHNICIYENQDVYAKFSLTYNPDETLSTRIINGGGKNPEFNENLRMKITQIDAVLKCEIWMLSRARNYMEDQLLGFTLVPISQVIGKGKLTRDYSLSSTDLFHSPAGTVQLTLSLIPSLPPIKLSANSSITSEVVLLDRKINSEEVMLDPVEYSRIEFPDINAVSQNQQMVTQYFDLAKHKHGSQGLAASFLRLGASPDQDYEMIVSSSPNESIHNSGFLSSTTTSLSDDRNNNSADSIEKKSRVASVTSGVAHQNFAACPDTPTSRKGLEASSGDEKSSFLGKEDEEEEEMKKDQKVGSGQFGQVYSAPHGNMNSEAEQSAMQQQIVDMYMRSMQQFTESLANMKLPMDLDKPECEDRGEVIPNNNLELDKKKEGSRVFYGSRAFF
ncbi:uncharacterized protein LOC133731963 [Rosa rugosa]|uniref:uncharacterized protein LOC133731963 n=1 Tax=Rosa rugosa TaxID=74645 RepID=UPI002B4039D5|nr:uncharacterized protein LOC133731963 [Rosa rugosa]XP_062015397.1 uncharacterized protein LOC133731963 [Rosa rugosa]